MSESVLCVRRDAFEAIGPFTGFVTGSQRWLGPLMATADTCLWADRPGVETSPDLIQLIPYVVVRRKAGEVAVYRRSKGGGEDRLHGRISCGFGGHCNQAADDGRNSPAHIGGLAAAWRCAWRELAEEAGITPDKIDDFRRIGLIYDPSNDVGKVHMGIVHEAWIRGGVKLDSGLSDEAVPGSLEWDMPSSLLYRCADEMEGWTRTILEVMASREIDGKEVSL